MSGYGASHTQSVVATQFAQPSLNVVGYLPELIISLFLRAMQQLRFVFLVQFFLLNALSAQRLCLTAHSEPVINLRSADTDDLITVPIVFHNLYRTSDHQVTIDQVLAQLEVLNADFRRLNSDTSETPKEFKAIAADCQIEFCLVDRDPFNDPTDGINYIQTDFSGIGLTRRYFQTRSGGQDIWDPTRFLNVWVCEISENGEIAGLAIPASSNFKEDEGIVIDYRFFGVDGTALEPFNKGRTLTHEIGHYLGLKHIWGDSISCQSDDGIADTPLQLDSYRGCPATPQSSCNSEDMFMNFMDLVDDACMNLFTMDQKLLMRGILQQHKPVLIQSNSCPSTVFAPQPSMPIFHVFPNPVSQEVILSFPLENIKVLSVQGTLIYQADRAQIINAEQFLPGIYFLTGRSRAHTFSSIFVKT